MAQSAYTPDQRDRAVALYLEVGVAEASRQTGIHKSTIGRWARQADVRRFDSEKTAAATAATRERVAERRAEARSLMAEKIVGLLHRIDQPHYDYKSAGKELHRVEYERAPAAMVKDYAISVGVLIDKLRLELGEHTSKEVSVEEARRLVVERLDEARQATLTV